MVTPFEMCAVLIEVPYGKTTIYIYHVNKKHGKGSHDNFENTLFLLKKSRFAERF